MTNVCKNTQGNTPITIYVLHGYTDGLTDPICKQPLSEDSRAAFPGQSRPY